MRVGTKSANSVFYDWIPLGMNPILRQPKGSSHLINIVAHRAIFMVSSLGKFTRMLGAWARKLFPPNIYFFL